MVGLSLAKSLYAIPTWTKVVELVTDHWKLQRALGCEGNPPSVYAAYRSAEKMRRHGDMLDRCIDSVVEGLKARLRVDARHSPGSLKQRDLGAVDRRSGCRNLLRHRDAASASAQV